MIRQPRPPQSFATMLAVALLVAAVGGCATPASPRTAEAPPGRAGAATPAAPHVAAPAAAASRRPTKLLVVVLENHDAASATRGMPYLTAQAVRYGRATTYFALAHPSLPNYLAMVGGTTFGVRDDRNPSGHRLRGSSVFGQVLARRGRTATTYAEGMRSRCQLTNAGRYAVRHNPWTYFVSERAACLRHDVPAGTTRRGSRRNDVIAGRVPTCGRVVPDRGTGPNVLGWRIRRSTAERVREPSGAGAVSVRAPSSIWMSPGHTSASSPFT